jgi:hypothetical protein
MSLVFKTQRNGKFNGKTSAGGKIKHCPVSELTVTGIATDDYYYC